MQELTKRLKMSYPFNIPKVTKEISASSGSGKKGCQVLGIWYCLVSFGTGQQIGQYA